MSAVTTLAKISLEIGFAGIITMSLSAFFKLEEQPKWIRWSFSAAVFLCSLLMVIAFARDVVWAVQSACGYWPISTACDLVVTTDWVGIFSNHLNSALRGVSLALTEITRGNGINDAQISVMILFAFAILFAIAGMIDESIRLGSVSSETYVSVPIFLLIVGFIGTVILYLTHSASMKGWWVSLVILYALSISGILVAIIITTAFDDDNNTTMDRVVFSVLFVFFGAPGVMLMKHLLST